MMVQSGWISTVSYNTEVFLQYKLEELFKAHIISDYMYIWHEPEEDETKGHFHVSMKVNKRSDTMNIQQFFVEIDPCNPKPRKCIDFRRTASIDDWILYSLHVGAYLACKGESRKYAYTKEDMKFADEDTFEYNYNHAFRGSDWALSAQRMKLIKENIDDPISLIYSNIVSIRDAGNLLSMQKMDRTVRGIRQNHEEV